MPSHLSTRIKASIPLFYLVEGNSSEWPGDVFPLAQKAIDMGEESVKLGVTCGHAV